MVTQKTYFTYLNFQKILKILFTYLLRERKTESTAEEGTEGERGRIFKQTLL